MTRTLMKKRKGFIILVIYTYFFQRSTFQKYSRPKKLRRVGKNRSVDAPPLFSLDPIFTEAGLRGPAKNDDTAYDEVMEDLLPQYLQARIKIQEEQIKLDENV